jgi:hypothetical protein
MSHGSHLGNHEDYACGFSGPHCWECGEPWPCRSSRSLPVAAPALDVERLARALVASPPTEEGYFPGRPDGWQQMAPRACAEWRRWSGRVATEYALLTEQEAADR